MPLWIARGAGRNFRANLGGWCSARTNDLFQRVFSPARRELLLFSSKDFPETPFAARNFSFEHAHPSADTGVEGGANKSRVQGPTCGRSPRKTLDDSWGCRDPVGATASQRAVQEGVEGKKRERPAFRGARRRWGDGSKGCSPRMTPDAFPEHGYRPVLFSDRESVTDRRRGDAATRRRGDAAFHRFLRAPRLKGRLSVFMPVNENAGRGVSLSIHTSVLTFQASR